MLNTVLAAILLFFFIEGGKASYNFDVIFNKKNTIKKNNNIYWLLLCSFGLTWLTMIEQTRCIPVHNSDLTHKIVIKIYNTVFGVISCCIGFLEKESQVIFVL